MVMRVRHGLTAVAVLLLVLTAAGCGSESSARTSPSVSASASIAPSSGSSEQSLRPTAVKIPKIGAESSLIAVGVLPDGKISVPSVNAPMQAAWYRFSPVPGEVGPAVVLGHVDGD